MLKKSLIFSLFFVAYTIVLAHSIIPHHHHNDDYESEQVSHHYDEDNHDDDHDESPLAKSFSHFKHIGTDKNLFFTFNETDNSILTKNDCAKHFLPVLFSYFRFVEVIAPNDFSERILFELPSLKGSSRSLRAPPAVC